MARPSLLLLFGVLICPLVKAADMPSPPTVSWEDQVRSMGYLIMHLSSINAINGINLTRQQAVDLRVMAKDMERSCPNLPSLTGTYRPDLGEVRDAYMATRALLLAGKEVPNALESRVGKARDYETMVIRQSLIKPVNGATTCVKCHGQPAAPDVRAPNFSALPMTDALRKSSPGEELLPHHLGLFGIGGSLKLLGYVDKVDKILKPEQKQAMTGFSCCLTPPKSMTDPVRAGQANGGEKEVGLFRWVRSIKEGEWQVVKVVGAGWVDKAVVMRSPGAKPAEIAAARAKVTELLEKVRKLSDSDFELEKDKLAGELRTIAGVSPEQAEKDRKFGTAMFLLVPGASKAYDGVIERLDQKK